VWYFFCVVIVMLLILLFALTIVWCNLLFIVLLCFSITPVTSKTFVYFGICFCYIRVLLLYLACVVTLVSACVLV